MTRNAGTAGRAVKTQSRKATSPRRAPKIAPRSLISTPYVLFIDDLRKPFEFRTRELAKAREHPARMFEQRTAA